MNVCACGVVSASVIAITIANVRRVSCRTPGWSEGYNQQARVQLGLFEEAAGPLAAYCAVDQR